MVEKLKIDGDSMRPEDYYGEDGKPIKCTCCNGNTFYSVSKDDLNGQVTEYEIICSTCDETVGYWAYGSFDPSFMNNIGGINK